MTAGSTLPVVYVLATLLCLLRAVPPMPCVMPFTPDRRRRCYLCDDDSAPFVLVLIVGTVSRIANHKSTVPHTHRQEVSTELAAARPPGHPLQSRIAPACAAGVTPASRTSRAPTALLALACPQQAWRVSARSCEKHGGRHPDRYHHHHHQQQPKTKTKKPHRCHRLSAVLQACIQPLSPHQQWQRHLQRSNRQRKHATAAQLQHAQYRCCCSTMTAGV